MNLIYWYIKGLLGLVGLGLAITAIATVGLVGMVWHALQPKRRLWPTEDDCGLDDGVYL